MAAPRGRIAAPASELESGPELESAPGSVAVVVPESGPATAPTSAPGAVAAAGA